MSNSNMPTRLPLSERLGVASVDPYCQLYEVAQLLLDRIEALERTAGDAEHLRGRVEDLERKMEAIESRAISTAAAREAERLVPIGGKPWTGPRTARVCVSPLTDGKLVELDAWMAGRDPNLCMGPRQPPQDALTPVTPTREPSEPKDAPQGQPEGSVRVVPRDGVTRRVEEAGAVAGAEADLEMAGRLVAALRPDKRVPFGCAEFALAFMRGVVADELERMASRCECSGEDPYPMLMQRAAELRGRK
jgi:hypothetical protein